MSHFSILLGGVGEILGGESDPINHDSRKTTVRRDVDPVIQPVKTRHI